MSHAEKNDYFLDITNEVCPITFVKTKLLIERVGSGAIVRVRLKGAEPLHNVPRSVADWATLLSRVCLKRTRPFPPAPPMNPFTFSLFA